MQRDDAITRRAFMGLGLASTGAAVVACADDGEPLEPLEPLDPADPMLDGSCEPPAPGGACELTPPDIEGPYYLPDSPERSELDILGDQGFALALSGLVSDASCAPLADVIVEIWHADPSGAYDNGETFNYRGWVRTGADGAYAFSTLVPGRYLNAGTLRPSHIHFKLSRAGVELLTTQLYFSGDAYLEGDPWAEPARTVCLESRGEGFAAVFDIALA